MEEEHLEILVNLFKQGRTIEWFDSTEGVYRKIEGFCRCWANDAVGDPEDFVNQQFTYMDDNIQYVDVYNTDPNAYFVVERRKLFYE